MERIGRYQILGELGRGGCGVVYRALDPGIGRTVAIKTILANHESGDMLRERFRREARSAGNLSHPNIVTIHELSDSGDVMFIAMEFIDGETLAQRMSGRVVPVAFALATIRAAASALDFAHASNIVHRDVKPANFLITKDGHLKITDFGIAKVLDSDVDLTSTGMVLGTAKYMSPEQVYAKEVTGRSDQFSLAVIAYELLAGQRPFQGDSVGSIMHSIVSSEPPPLKQYNENLRDEVTDVLRKALAKEPENRFASCKEFSQALERAVLGHTAEQETSWQDALKAPVAADAKTVIVVPTSPNPIRNVGSAKTTMITNMAATAMASTSHDPAFARKRSWAVPVATAAVIVIGLGAWLVLRREPVRETTPSSQAAQTAPATSVPAQPATAPPPAEAQPPQSPATASTAPAVVTTQQSRDRASNVVAAPAASATSVPVPAGPAPAAPPLSTSTTANTSAVTLPAPITPTPAAVVPPAQPVPAPKVTEPVSVLPSVTAAAPANAAPAAASPPTRPVDAPDTAAQRRAAEIQASRRMVADAVNRYRQAFEAGNIEGLKAVWPSLGRTEQASFQNFFRIARTVKLQLTPVGEPEVTASGATGTYRRTLNATDERGPLPAQNQTVKITFLKSGEQMLVEAIDVVGR